MKQSYDRREELDKHDDTVFGIAQELRLDLADVIIFGLRRMGWTQKELADRIGVKPSKITALVFAQGNPTFETAAKIFQAFGMRAQLCELKRKSPKGKPNGQENIRVGESQSSSSFDSASAESAAGIVAATGRFRAQVASAHYADGPANCVGG